jgi:hypothetical protein
MGNLTTAIKKTHGVPSNSLHGKGWGWTEEGKMRTLIRRSESEDKKPVE